MSPPGKIGPLRQAQGLTAACAWDSAPWSVPLRARPAMPNVCKPAIRRSGRECESESRARARCALDADRASVRLDDLLHDREAESRAVLARISFELVEDSRQHLRRDTRCLAVIASTFPMERRSEPVGPVSSWRLVLNFRNSAKATGRSEPSPVRRVRLSAVFCKLSRVAVVLVSAGSIFSSTAGTALANPRDRPSFQLPPAVWRAKFARNDQHACQRVAGCG